MSAETMTAPKKPPTPRKKAEETAAEVLPQTTPQDVSARGASQTVSQWSKTDIDSIGLVFSLCLVFGSARISEMTDHSKDYTMQDTEADAIAMPLARIATRHIKVKAARKGDMADIVAATAAGMAYGIRVAEVIDQKKKGVTR